MKMKRVIACILALLMLNTEIGSMGFTESEIVMSAGTEITSPVPTQPLPKNEGAKTTPKAEPATQAESAQTGAVDSAPKGEGSPTVKAPETETKVPETAQAPQTSHQTAGDMPSDETTQVPTATKPAVTPAVQASPDSVIPGEDSTESSAPVATPEITLVPETTEPLETSNAPEASITPEASATAEPGVPVTPEASATAEPEVSATPEASATTEPGVSATPEASVTPEASESPLPFILENLTAERQTYAPGDVIRWNFTCDGAQSIDYEIRDRQGSVAAHGTLAEAREITFQTEICNTYTLTVNAHSAGETLSASSTVYVTLGDVGVSVATDMRYAVAGEWALAYQAQVSGGVAPYTVNIEVLLGGKTVYSEARTLDETGIVDIAYMPTSFGEHTVKVAVTDALGVRAEAFATLPVAVREPESASDWERSVRGAAITGDWREDLVAIAVTQLGYKESARDFTIDEDGKVQGYTRYGDWYGSAYEEWCAMFVSFCLNYARIPESGVPRAANCERWKDALSGLGVYERDTDAYVPEKGDLIFFKDEKGSLRHVGIVERVSERTVYTIEGNSGRAVRRQSYARSDRSIAGYASMRKLMDRAGILEQFEAPAPQARPEPVGALILVERYGELQGESVNLRALPTVESEAVRTLPGGTQLWVVDGAEYADGYTWYSVLDEDGTLYYVRGDLLYIPEAEASAQTPAPVGEAELVEKTGVLSGNEANAAGLYALPLQDGEPALTLPGGTEVWVVSRAEYDGGSVWYSVLYEDTAYYVRVDDLIFPETAEAPAALAESVLVERYGILMGESVDLYTQPASQGEVAWTLPGGTQLWLVSMAEYADGYIWYEVLYEDGTVYYVRGDFLTIPEEKPAAREYAVEVTISPAVARLGDTLTFTANIIGEAPEGLTWQWQASADGAGWYNIDGATGETYSVQADMTVFLQQYRVVAVETHEEETQDQTLLAFLDCFLFPAAIAEETQTPPAVYSPAVQPVLFSNGTAIYWNPNGSPTFNENGFIIIAAGNDANNGSSAQVPVQSLDVAIALAERDGVSDIICMNRSDLYADGTYELKDKRLVRYAGDGNSEAAHNGLFFSVKSGTLTLSNAIIEDTDTIIELDGGALALNGGLSLAGEIRIERPDAGILPITVNDANAAAGEKYVVSFDPDTQLERVGVAAGEQLSTIALNAALTDDNWVLYVDGDGNTYARKLPKYAFIYLDGVNGSDSNLGNTPQTPVLTFERAKALLAQYAPQGVDTIYVMNTVGISDEATYSLSDTGANNPKLVRYETCTGPMFRVEAGAAATFDDLVIDGNGANTALVEVEAGALMINGGSISGSTDGVVVKNGELTLGSGAGIQCTSGSGAAVTGGTLTVGNAMIRATNGGNGIAMYGGSLTVQSGASIQVDVSSATQSGWGIVTTGGALDIQGGTISGRGGVFVNQGTQSASISGASISTVNADIDHPALRINADAVNLEIKNNTTLRGTNAITVDAGNAVLEGNVSLVAVRGGSFELSSGSVNDLAITDGMAKVSGGTVAALNADNNGEAEILEGTVNALSLKGQANVTVNGGTVEKAGVNSSTANLYAYGGAFTGQIHLTADNSTVHTNGQASINEIFLDGKDTYVLLSDVPAQEKAIMLNVGNANLREEQIVVRPEGTLADASAALGKFALTSPTDHQFTLEGKENNIILRIKGVFVDTARGSDGNDGLSKDQPVKTFAKAAEVMKAQLDADPLFLRYINVLDEATISGTDTLNMAGYDNVRVIPYIANMGTLITVPAGADFKATNVLFSGSSNDSGLSTNADVLINAEGGTVSLTDVAANYAKSEAIQVSGGQVTVGGDSTISNSGTGVSINDGTFSMTGGKISSNGRSGVSATGGTFKMTDGSITGNGGANNGGGVYLGADAAAEMKSVTISGNSGLNGGGLYLDAGAKAVMTGSKVENNSAENGGGVYLDVGATAEMDSVTISGNSGTNNGGGIYLDAGATAEMKSVTISGNSGTNNGGGVYLECGAALNVTNKLTVSSNTATQGGGLYIGGGTDGTCVHALGDEYSITGNTATQGGGVYFACLGSMTLDGTMLTNNSAELGGAICTAAGTTVFKSANTEGCSATTGGSALYIMKEATFDHASGTLTGSAYAEGTYKLNAADATVKVAAGEINLRNVECPMMLYGDTLQLDSANKITVRVNEIFINSVIIDGSDSVSALLDNFVVNGLPASEQNGDIIGGASIHVFWDPQNLAGNANDRNGGTSPTDAVSSFARAKNLLSQKSPESHIVMCSQYTSSGTFDGRVTNSTTGESWNATLVRGYAGNVDQTPLTGYMFEYSGTYYFSNITFDDAEEMRLHNKPVQGGFVEASTIYLKAGTALKNSPSSAEAAIYALNIYVQSPDVLFEGNDCAVLSRFNSTGTIQITGGTFKDNRYAIEINPNTNSYIRGTSDSPVVFQGNTTAVTFGNMAQYNYTLNMAISYAEFTDNSTGLQGTTGNGTYGSLTLDVDNCVFSGNGTALSSGSKVTATVKNCTFTDAKTRELSISGSSSKTTITECMLDGVSAGSAFEGEASASTATGIYISGSGSVSITNTDIEDYSKCFDFNSYTSSATIGTNILIRPGINGTAIYTYSSSGRITLNGNVDIELNGASSKGIHTTYNGANITLREGWSITGRQLGWGIYLDSTSYTLSASGGAIQNCEYGLYLEGGTSSNCTLTDVEISGNQQDGIYANPGSSNGGNLNILGHSQVSNNVRSGIYVSSGKWTVKIDGASIENNGLTGTSAYGGVYLSSSNIQSADILNTLVSGNRSTTSGGGIYANASVTLTDNTIANNQVVCSRSSNESTTAKGGGVYLGKASTLTGNTIAGNTATAQEVSGDYGPRGGGVYVNSGTITLANNTISGNTAENGGGIYVNAGEAILTGSSVAGNTASQNGGGVYLNSTGKATINGSGAITGNTAQYGGGIYATSNATGELVLASGEVSANVSTADSGKSSGIYNAGRTLKMAGSRVDVTDNIYLNHRDYPITLTSPLSGGSNYRIAVNANSYKVRDVVVQPLAGGYPSNVAQYLRNTTAVDAGFVFAKGTDPDVSGSGVNYIVIKRCIFVSDSGSDSNTGATPDEAYRTMAKALEQASTKDDCIIYVCGRVTASGNTAWSCAKPVEIRRYTGFAIGGTDAYPAYTGTMFSIPAGASVTVNGNISLISGRHTEEDTIRPTGSIFDVQGNLNFAQSTRIGGNTGSADGGAIRVGQGGTVTISSALSIENTRGADGGAIYNEGSVLVNGGGSLSITNASAAGDGDAVYQAGTFSLENGASLSAAGTVYLTNDAHLTLASHAVTLTDPLNLDIADPYDGRVYVQYGSSEEADVQRARYSLPTRITSSYVLTDGVDGNGHLQLKLGQKNVVYVDPNYTGGTQEGKVQGITADYPFTNLKDAYEYLKDQGGGLIYIVDTIPVDGDVMVGEREYTGPDGEKITLESGGVSIKRYSQPEEEIEGFTHPTHTGALFEVQNGGSLTLDGVVVDGHSNPVTSASEKYSYTIAPAVEANAPIVDVQEGGALNLTGGAQLGNNQNASGADAIKNGGTVSVNGSTTVRGSVKLEPDKFITVTTGTQTRANAMEILLDDPEDGRVIAEYGSSIPDAGELEKYLLPEEILRDYYLAIEGTKVVLKAKKAAYVDGINGNDVNEGLSPENPVRTLEQAYENLQANGGTIYIVNTVTIAEDMRLMPKQYIQGATSIEIASGDVRILRYSKPNAADTLTGFSVESFTGELIKVERGVSLALDGIVIDGHSQARNTGEETTTANGVAAESPLLRVYGTLEIENGAALQNNHNAAANTFGGAIHILATGKVKIVDGMIQGNDAGLGEGIFHFGMLEVSGTPGLAEGQWIYMGEDEVVHVTGTLNLASRLQVDFPADYYVDGHVVAVYADGLTPQPAQFILGQTNLMSERGLSLVAEGQNLVLRAANAFDVTQDVTLYAAAEPAADQPQSAEIDLAGLGVDVSKLQGLEFKVESVTLPDGSSLEIPISSVEVDAKKTTAGSNFANSTVAITALPGGEGTTPTDMIEDQTLVFGSSLTANTAKLTLNLHCANAITAADTESSAPTLTIVLASANGDRITLNVKIVRIPSQINATVPLVIVVKTNIEGGSIQGSDLQGYAIENESLMRVQLTDAVVTDSDVTYGGIDLKPAENTPGLDEYRITLDAATGQDGKLESAKDLFAYGELDNTYNPIAAIETGRLSFVTMQATGGLEQGVKLANIAYKLAIPEDDQQP